MLIIIFFHSRSSKQVIAIIIMTVTLKVAIHAYKVCVKGGYYAKSKF